MAHSIKLKKKVAEIAYACLPFAKKRSERLLAGIYQVVHDGHIVAAFQQFHDSVGTDVTSAIHGCLQATNAQSS